jgi:enolase
VPSGASTGAHEAIELRDGDSSRFGGKGVRKAVQHVNDKIAPELLGFDVTQQTLLDQTLIEMDGTENKGALGANAILGVSLACAKAAAAFSDLPFYQYMGGTRACRLPVPLMNVLNGGAHANNGLDVQEFMIVPVLENFHETLRAGCEIFQSLKKLLNEKHLSTAVGDEGGFAPVLKSNQEALDLLMVAVEKSGYRAGENVFFALDVAATELYKDGQYRWENQMFPAEKLANVYKGWTQRYPLISIEDGFAEDDWEAWSHFTQDMGSRVQLVGDDLFVTNPKRIQEGIVKKAANALLVKINQIGTLTETGEAVSLAQRAGFQTVMSHRSGETEDVSISDLAVGFDCSQIKTGSLCRGERINKYNQLLRIEEELGEAAFFWGKQAFSKRT